MKEKQICAQGAGHVLRRQGCWLLEVRSVLWCVYSWWTTEGRQKRPDGRQAKMRSETKPKKTRVDHNEVVGFRWICVCLVFRRDPVWYRMIYRDMSWYHISHIMRYHKIRYIEISYPYPDFIEISYPVEIILDTEHYVQHSSPPGATTCRRRHLSSH